MAYLQQKCSIFSLNILAISRQTRKPGPALARLRVHWPNIVPYMGIHWANFPGLLGSSVDQLRENTQ